MSRHGFFKDAYDPIRNEVLVIPATYAESACRRGKSAFLALAVGALFALSAAGTAFALPTGGEVTAGSGSIAQSGSQLTITQQSPNLAVNWQGFSIAAGEWVRFAQPSALAIALNRVLGQDPSQIFGSLSANGQVFILNPNGVLFGQGAQVNVGGLVASTLSLSNEDFLAGRYYFQGTAAGGRVENFGHLSAAEGGYIALLAPEVRNEGVISARLENHQGVIKLLGDMAVGEVRVGGTLDASAPNGGDGGFIETSAHSLRFDDPTITASAPYGKGGMWLIDPTRYNY